MANRCAVGLSSVWRKVHVGDRGPRLYTYIHMSEAVHTRCDKTPSGVQKCSSIVEYGERVDQSTVMVSGATTTTSKEGRRSTDR